MCASHPHPTRTIWNTKAVCTICILYKYFNTNYFLKSNLLSLLLSALHFGIPVTVVHMTA